jgi:hypothetical protein
MKGDMNMKVELRLRDVFRGVEVNEKIKNSLIGSVIEDEDGKNIGTVIDVNIEDDIAICELNECKLAHLFKENYKTSMEVC